MILNIAPTSFTMADDHAAAVRGALSTSSRSSDMTVRMSVAASDMPVELGTSTQAPSRFAHAILPFKGTRRAHKLARVKDLAVTYQGGNVSCIWCSIDTPVEAKCPRLSRMLRRDLSRFTLLLGLNDHSGRTSNNTRRYRVSGYLPSLVTSNIK